MRVDQSPLSRTPRSNAALYLGAYDSIRDLFAGTDAARSQGYTAGDFSFNGGTGRCPRCNGSGAEKIEMQFLADVFVTCPICEGRRFQAPLLQVQYRGKNIHEVLEMTVDEARKHFDPGRCRSRQPRSASCTRKSARSSACSPKWASVICGSASR